MQPKLFTLEAANAVVPRLSELVKEQLDRRAAIDARFKALSSIVGELPDRIAIDAQDTEQVRAMKQDLLERVSDYQRCWSVVEQMGAVLKDPRVGLVDFYGRVDGELVWLCWKYGESEVGYYHALNEGFAARKPLAEGLRQRMLN